ELDIPHTTVEQYEFFRRQEIKDAIAYLRILVNRYDVNSLHRILLRPRKAIGGAAVRDIVSSGQKVGLRQTDMVLPRTFTMGEPYGLLLERLSVGEITVIDVETTGLIPVRDEVIEIADIKLSKGKICEKFHCHVKNTIPVGDSQKIHGLTDEFLREQGKDSAEALDGFKHFIGNSLVVGHNIGFDVRILLGNAIRSGIQMPIWSFEDTLDIAKRFLTADRYDLESLANLLGLSARPSHKAMDDVLSTLELLARLVKFITPGANKRKEIVLKYEKSFRPLAESIQAWRNHLNSRRPPELLDIILYESGLSNYYQGDPKRLHNLKKLQLVFAEKDNAKLDPQSAMEEILSFTALSKNIDHLMESDNRVPVIT
ncbi:DNA helicase UvrD, partial [bacterium]|nr:DNA helicase UvrD [bacterium]